MAPASRGAPRAVEPNAVIIGPVEDGGQDALPAAGRVGPQAYGRSCPVAARRLRTVTRLPRGRPGIAGLRRTRSRTCGTKSWRARRRPRALSTPQNACPPARRSTGASRCRGLPLGVVHCPGTTGALYPVLPRVARRTVRGDPLQPRRDCRSLGGIVERDWCGPGGVDGGVDVRVGAQGRLVDFVVGVIGEAVRAQRRRRDRRRRECRSSAGSAGLRACGVGDPQRFGCPQPGQVQQGAEQGLVVRVMLKIPISRGSVQALLSGPT
jgi:hypothetical protein